MDIRRILVLAAFLAISLSACNKQEPPSSLAGRWQYLQSSDKEGEVLDLVASSDRWRGVMNGLERSGEHGIYYYVVEIEDLVVAPDGDVSFIVGPRKLFKKRPDISQLGGHGDGGFVRSPLRFAGRVVAGDLVLQCSDTYGDCPGASLRFKRLSSPPNSPL